jgi:ABC-type nitrate/sulfonate/bicarbonate transport system substrate-binding protein
MRSAQLRIGFVPLVDAAPLVAAQERGYFAEEGISVILQRQLGWANVRDKLSFGQLDAAHSLLGMPLASHLGRDSFTEPLVALMGLGCGGNAITVRRQLHEMGVTSASDLARVMKEHPGMGRPLVGHVFGSSMHHYLVRAWLDSGGINPDRDVKLCVIPPPQMSEHMRGGYLDLFCVGEPWNTLAEQEGAGVTLVATTDILPRHPEKVLAVSRRFADQVGGIGGHLMTGLVRAVLRGCMWCAEALAADGGGELAGMLSRPEYLAQPRQILERSLAIGRDFGASRVQKNARPKSWVARSFSPEMNGGTFPNKMHAVWMMQEMIRWEHLHADADVIQIAERCCDARAYRTAATSLGVGCPESDFVAMELRGGRMLRPEDVRKVRRTDALPATDHSHWNAEPRGRSPARVA